MLSYVEDNIVNSSAQTVVNTVNTVGVMGKGLAAHFRDQYPQMFVQYKEYCEKNLLQIGKLWLWKGEDQWVLNFPTKKHWRNPSKLEYIEAGLQKFVAEYEKRGIVEVSFPKLGCGNGGLQWADVRPLMEKYLSSLPINVYIHTYEKNIGQPEHVKLAEPSGPLTFDTFVKDIVELVSKANGEFSTLLTNRAYGATVESSESEDEGVIFQITRSGKKIRVRENELFSFWNLLTKGIADNQSAEGNARNEFYYLLPLIARLPYVRLVKKKKSDDGLEKIGITLQKGCFESESLTKKGNESIQEGFRWESA